MSEPGAKTPAELEAELRARGAERYHDRHPFHVRMHDGALGPAELRCWVRNRYYYQTRLPIKDALIISKSEDAAFRRRWRRRLSEQDGDGDDAGGLELWLRLCEAVGLDRQEVRAHRGVLPGVRFACDAYVDSVARFSLVEAVAASLTECFAPDLMSARIQAWERHYPWVDAGAIAYFRSRVGRARRDSEEALDFVLTHATSADLQRRCVAALVRKTEILWHLLDGIQAHCERSS